MQKKTEHNKALTVIESVENNIHVVRGQRVMFDSDLAEVYKVETKVLNQAVKRNLQRFPSDFMFQLNADEVENLRSQTETSKHGAAKREVS